MTRCEKGSQWSSLIKGDVCTLRPTEKTKRAARF